MELEKEEADRIIRALKAANKTIDFSQKVIDQSIWVLQHIEKFHPLVFRDAVNSYWTMKNGNKDK